VVIIPSTDQDRSVARDPDSNTLLIVETR